MAEQDTSFRWHHWSVTAPKEDLLALVAALDAALPTGWRKLTGDETPTPTPLAPDVFTGYQFAPQPGLSGVTLTIDLWRDSELRGGRMFGTFPSSAAERAKTTFAGAVVDHFLDDGLLPAAAKVGVEVRKGTTADIFFDNLSWEARDSLRKFDTKARKVLPLDWSESEAWQALVIAAQRGPDNVEYGLLADWLVSRGWPKPMADELSERFFDQLQLLSRYRDSLVIV